MVRDSGAAPIACGKDAGELDYILKNVSVPSLRRFYENKKYHQGKES